MRKMLTKMLMQKSRRKKPNGILFINPKKLRGTIRVSTIVRRTLVNPNNP